MDVALSIRQVRPSAALRSPLGLALSALSRQPVAMLAMAVVLVVVVLAVGAELIAPFDPASADWSALREARAAPICSAPTISAATSCPG